MKNKALLLIFAFVLLYSNRMSAQVLTQGMDAVDTRYGFPDSTITTLWKVNSLSPVADIKTIGDQSVATPGVNWVPTDPVINTWTVGTMGQIFGTAIDDVGNVYFAATAMYWTATNVFDRNTPQRLADATTGVSSAGGSGYHLSGGPAGIYKADKANLSNVTVLTGTVPAVPGINKIIPNTGYGLGNIAYAKGIDKLYASNLEDGKIYCIHLPSGTIDYVYDPFGPDLSGAQIADYGHRIFGLAVNYELLPIVETRLYYAVLMSNNQSVIWSVKLNNDGSFDGSTNSLEINLPVSFPRTYISDMAFSCRGEMLVAEKGDPHNANVYQYFGKHLAWSLPMELYMASYPAGNPGHNSAGGVDYGYSSKDTTNKEFFCDTIIWTQSNAIRGNNGFGPWLAYGLLSHPLNDYVTPATYLSEAYIVNLKGIVAPNGEGVTPKGSFGDVECYDWQCPPNQTDICHKTDAKLTKIDSGECCYKVEISNKYRPDYFSAVSITSSNLSIANVTKDVTCIWANFTLGPPTQVVFKKTPSFSGIPIDGASGFQTLGTICFAGSGPSIITIDFIGNPPQYDTVCTKIVTIEGCSPPPPDTTCVVILDLKAECDAGAVKMMFRIKNISNYTMRGLTLYSQTPDVIPSPKFIPIPDLLPNQTSPFIETTLIVSNNATSACFFFAACDQNTTPGIAGPYPDWCCIDSVLYCVDIPHCDPCDGISFTKTKKDPEKCCYSLSLTSNYYNANIKYLEFDGIGGTQFALFTGWSIIGYVSSNHI
ncbi:MAG TPA: hypothetical protein VF298_02400, partial [Bacteroidales bacterium]